MGEKEFLNVIKVKVINENIDTVYSKTGYKQFMVYDYETSTASNMTEDNCADYEFITRPVEKPTVFSRLTAFFDFFKMIVGYLRKIFNGSFAFSDILG